MLNPKVRAETSGKTRRKRRQDVNTDNPVGKRVLEALGDRDFAWLSAQTGIPDSTIGDSVKRGISRADTALKIARALDTTVEWLLEGQGNAARRNDLLDVADADWMSVPRYDLLRFTPEGKPEALDVTPIRRDWLARQFRATTDLWLTEMPSDAMPDVAREGDTILCRDVQPREPDLIDGRVYIFMLDGSPIIRRLSLQPGRLILNAGDPTLPPITVERSDPPHTGEGLAPIARVLGRFGLQLA